MNFERINKKIFRHKYYMNEALKLAAKGIGYTSPNPMVGALIVKNGKIVGKGYHKKAGSNHAEVEAINDAGSDANGATIYVNLEPCNHEGKTPPCTIKIIKSGIKCVVFALKDPNPYVKGNSKVFLKQNGIKVISGICKNKASILNESFIKYIQTGYPFITIKCAATLNGYITTNINDSKWITGYKARQYSHAMRHASDAILIGKNTFYNDNPRLTTRLDNTKGANPIRLIMDTHFSIKNSFFFNKDFHDSKTYIVTNKKKNELEKKYFQNNGLEIITIKSSNNKINMKKLVKFLGSIGITSLIIEGGSQIIESTLSSGIADKISFFYAPKILTGKKGLPICIGKEMDSIKNCIKLNKISIKNIGDDILVNGYIKKKG